MTVLVDEKRSTVTRLEMFREIWYGYSVLVDGRRSTVTRRGGSGWDEGMGPLGRPGWWDSYPLEQENKSTTYHLKQMQGETHCARHMIPPFTKDALYAYPPTITHQMEPTS